MLRRGIILSALVLVGAGAWAVANRDELRTGLAVRRLKSASTDDERMKLAEELAARDDGPHELVSLCSDPALRSAAAAALAKHLDSLPATDPGGTELCVNLLNVLASADESERDALAPLLPMIVQRTGTNGRAVVSAALKSPSASARVAAIRAAIHPNAALRAEVVPLLNAPEAEVRRAAMFAIGPAAESEAVIGDEELFRWLHDADADVRDLCRSALASRGRSDGEILLGKRLLDPDASERLELLLDLRYDEELPDVGPWLERLSRDSDPGVRAGAARVMLEISGDRMLPAPAWVARLAEADPSPSVRRIAKHFQMPANQTPDPAIRLIQALDGQ
jgi:hypothetical protein